jgi:hypothetical protein
MSPVDIDPEVAAALAVLRAEQATLTREHQRLEMGWDDLAAHRAHAMKLRMHQQRLIDVSARLRRGWSARQSRSNGGGDGHGDGRRRIVVAHGRDRHRG